MIPILGMHRSGTSALAGALHKLGADLGSESSWLAPAADNPTGFFEFEPVVAIDRAILAAFGGTWSSPPPLPPGWTEDSRIDDERARAEQLLAELPGRLVVKDPRLSLTLPLWDALADPLDAVLCLRNPTTVAMSLEKRNGFTIDQGLLLWFRYNAAARLNRPSALVVEYEQIMNDPATELARVAGHIGLEASESAVDVAVRSIKASLVHHEATELPESPVGVLCRRLYNVLRAGGDLEGDDDANLWARLITEFPWAGPSDREIGLAHNARRDLEQQVDRLTRAHDRLEQRSRRLETDLRRTLSLLDRLAVTETTALLSDLEDTVP